MTQDITTQIEAVVNFDIDRWCIELYKGGEYVVSIPCKDKQEADKQAADMNLRNKELTL